MPDHLTSLRVHSQVQAAQAAAPKAGPGKFPPAMCAYVERVFAQQVPPERKAAMQAELKAIIEDANAKGEMWTRDWDTAPLPSAAGGAAGSSSARSAATAAAAAISAKVAKEANRWDTARRGSEHTQWSSAKGTAAEEPSRRGRLELPDWRPNNEWKKANKRQKKVRRVLTGFHAFFSLSRVCIRAWCWRRHPISSIGGCCKADLPIELWSSNFFE